MVTVLIATRGRPSALEACLETLALQDRAMDRVVIVENVERAAATQRVVDEASRRGLPAILVHEPFAGLGRAHNRGLPLCGNGYVAITDDDVLLDARWLGALCDALDSDPLAGAATGRITPRSLETEAERFTEEYARYDKGDARRMFSLVDPPDDPLFPLAIGSVGSGANMAFRLAALREIGGFDSSLGAGTPARGGDDLAALLDVLMAGWRVVYEPGAIISHEHPTSLEALDRQMFGYGAGLTAYLTRSLRRHPELIGHSLVRLPRAARHILAKDSAKNSGKGNDFPATSTRRERVGMAAGPMLYLKSGLASRRIRARRLSIAPNSLAERTSILLYHGVAERSAPRFQRWNVTPDEFSSQMRDLQRRGLKGVSVSEFVSMNEEGASVEGVVGITFDDAFADVARNALPVLSGLGFGATVFVPTAFVGVGAGWLAPEGEGERPVMSWLELEQAAAQGFEIGSHSHTHRALDLLTPDEIESEVAQSTELIERRLGARPRTFAYPHGYHDNRVRRIVRAAGFEAACGVAHALTSVADDPLGRARVIVPGGCSISSFHDLTDPTASTLPVAPTRRAVRRWAWRSARRARERMGRVG